MPLLALIGSSLFSLFLPLALRREHRRTASCLAKLAEVLVLQGKNEAAEGIAEEAYMVREGITEEAYVAREGIKFVKVKFDAINLLS